MISTIYKIATQSQWQEAEAVGRFTGAPIDIADGYIHFSTAAQAAETAHKHFFGQQDLLLVAVDVARLGDMLKFEVSRGGALFPHLYEPLELSAVLWVKPLPVRSDGQHEFPPLEDA
ncbi:DUF952 domain-containing protein [Mesorhizobium sp. NBSH29]|uniref:DUF952 domain-containing protein n=1 Tax=Mesorhizobium sp. NBSH29 TaxID=2654249 RepID=UPI0018964574|nr:DUF952 domain-containing protein [Mesorhizobium sp. NBSH29]QPC86753.1 DUF952 domain-containing protein [Mesorhizobium sp. NBSH29]